VKEIEIERKEREIERKRMKEVEREKK